jgi:hypothetical protein
MLDLFQVDLKWKWSEIGEKTGKQIEKKNGKDFGGSLN